MSVSTRSGAGARIASRATWRSPSPPRGLRTRRSQSWRPSRRTAQLAELVETGEATTKRGVARAVHLDGARQSSSAAARCDEVDADVLRDAAAAVVAEVRRPRVARSRGRSTRPCRCRRPSRPRALVEGAILGDYEPGRVEDRSRARAAEVTQLALVTDADVADGVGRAETAAPWANRARDLVNRPANDLSPGELRRVRGEPRRRHARPQRRGARARRDARARHGRPARRRSGQLQRASPHRPALGASRRRPAATSCSGSSARA